MAPSPGHVVTSVPCSDFTKGLNRTGSTLVSAPSFEDVSPESSIVASMLPSDASAATLSSLTSPSLTTPSTGTASGPGTTPTPSPESLHRGATLDRALDAVASQDLRLRPEAACARSMMPAVKKEDYTHTG